MNVFANVRNEKKKQTSHTQNSGEAPVNDAVSTYTSYRPQHMGMGAACCNEYGDSH